MPRRSSNDDPNVAAFNIVREATGDTPDSGPEALSILIREIAGCIEAGESPESIADRLWPRLEQMVRSGTAAELGRKGGRKGGKARAKSLSPDERSEIARVAAQARWKKATGGHDRD